MRSNSKEKINITSGAVQEEEIAGIRRRPYEKPAILVVPLVAEEVLGVGCKSSGSAGPASKVSCMSTSCFASGS